MILLLRHGRTAANASGLLLGRADPALDDEGRRQAVRLADAVGASGRKRVTRIVTSPLERCRQTAAVVGDRLGVEIESDDHWLELDYGELDGASIRSVSAATWKHWVADISWRPPGGESLAELGVRVRAACEELADPAAGQDVVVVTHVSPIKAAVAWALGVGDEVSWRMYVAPASISRIATDGARRSLRSFNDVAHLG